MKTILAIIIGAQIPIWGYVLLTNFQ